MRNYVLSLIILTLISSCESEEVLPTLDLCEEERYYYYSGGSQIFFRHSLSEIWITFKEKEVSRELAESIVAEYTFLDFDFQTGGNYEMVSVRINERCDCTEYKAYLEELNRDEKIYAATPIFYFSENNPHSYFIMLSEVITKYDSNHITETDFIDYAETLNLKFIESSSRFNQHFSVKEVKTGFEALEIANQIFESGKVEFSHTNGIASIRN